MDKLAFILYRQLDGQATLFTNTNISIHVKKEYSSEYRASLEQEGSVIPFHMKNYFDIDRHRNVEWVSNKALIALQ